MNSRTYAQMILLFALGLLFPALAKAECTQFKYTVWSADTFKGAKVSDEKGTNLTPFGLQQTGCVLTGTFWDPACGIKHEVAITLTNGGSGDISITRSAAGKSAVMSGKVNMTAKSFSWSINNVTGDGLDNAHREDRTFVPLLTAYTSKC